MTDTTPRPAYADRDQRASGGLTYTQLEESLRQVEAHAYDPPVVHWPGLDAQEEFTFPPVSIRRPTRCGVTFISALVTHRRDCISCEPCRELLAADDKLTAPPCGHVIHEQRDE